MRKWIVNLFMAVLPWTVIAGSNFDEGIKAFEKKEYNTAIEKFKESLEVTPNDVASYYNLGLAHHESKSYGDAIWSFEKVLKLSPSDAAAKQAIERSYAALDPKKTWEPQLNRLQSALYGFSGSTWSIIAIAFSVLLSVCLILFARSKNLSSKRLYVALSAFCLVSLVCSAIIANGSAGHASATNYAIVTQKSINTFKSDKKVSSAELHEGERLLLLEQKKTGLINVSSSSGDTYYIEVKDVAFI